MTFVKYFEVPREEEEDDEVDVGEGVLYALEKEDWPINLI